MLPEADLDLDWLERRNFLAQTLHAVSNHLQGHVRTKRSDLYGPSWLYQMVNRKPGSLPPILADTIPNLLGCFGINLGCMACVAIRATVDANPLGGCLPPCAANIGNGCGNAWGVFLSKELSAKSVVCTELFNQGYIDAETFLADSQFGALLESKDPLVLKGYRMLANPLVAVARSSQIAAKSLDFVTSPFMSYMKYYVGLKSQWSTKSVLGWVGTEVAKPLCRIAGYLSDFVPSFHQSISLF